MHSHILPLVPDLEYLPSLTLPRQLGTMPYDGNFTVVFNYRISVVFWGVNGGIQSEANLYVQI